MIRARRNRIKSTESGINDDNLPNHGHHRVSFIILKVKNVQIPRYGGKIVNEEWERWKCAFPHCQEQPVNNSDQQWAILPADSAEDKI
jgi:hypothetical protein